MNETLGRFRTTHAVTYSNSSIRPGAVLDAVPAHEITGFAGMGIRKQIEQANKRTRKGDPAPDPVVAVFWDGQHRTVPLRFLEPVE